MPKFEIRFIKNISETALFEVEAPDEDAADAIATRMVSDYNRGHSSDELDRLEFELDYSEIVIDYIDELSDED